MILHGIALFFAIYVAGSMLAVHVLYSAVFFGRTVKPENSLLPRYVNYPGYSRLPHQFKSGKNTLYAHLYGAENNKALVVISHGIGDGSEGYIAETIWFVDHGYRVFSYDCTGSHTSEGKGTTGMAQSALDLHAALSYIKENDDLSKLPLLLYGHSWGAYGAAAVLAGPHTITAAVCISGYNTPNGIVFESARAKAGPFVCLEYPFMALENFFRFGKVSLVSAVKGINAVQTPVLVIHGAADKIVLFDGASIIAQQKSITNPNVEYCTRSKEGQNGHNNLYLSERAVQYEKEMRDKNYKEIDPLVKGELDAEFMNRVNQFYEKSLRPAD